MKKQFFSRILFGFWLFASTSFSYADPLFSNPPNSRASAGSIQIDASGSALLSSNVLFYFYTGAACTSLAGTYNETTGGGFLFSPSATVAISAAGVYQEAVSGGFTGTSIQSFKMVPHYTSGSFPVFTTSPPCFSVDCSNGTACVGSDVANLVLENTPPTAISNYADFITWNGSGNAYLTSNITINDTNYSSSATPFSLSSGETFDGRGYTVTVDNGGSPFNGLFQLAGGTIQHLNLTISSGALASFSGWLAYGINSGSVNGAYGIIYNTNVTATGSTMNAGAGGFVGGRAAVASNGSSFVTGSSTNNLTIADCKYTGPFPSAGGGILGKFASNITNSNDGTSGGGVISIKRCFVNITATASNGGGITGSYMAKNYSGTNNSIQETTVTGTASTNFTGGFIGSDSYGDITNSYSLYTIGSRTNSGGFYHQKAHGSITTSYFLGSSISGSNSASFISTAAVGQSVLNITNCATSEASFGNGSDISLAGTNLTSYTTGTANTTEPINSSFNSVIWDKTAQPPILSTFKNAALWSGYSAYGDTPTIVFTTAPYGN